MWPSVAEKEEQPVASPEELHATTERLQRRMRRLHGCTNDLRQSNDRLKAATERLREKLQSSFPEDADAVDPEAEDR